MMKNNIPQELKDYYNAMRKIQEKHKEQHRLVTLEADQDEILKNRIEMLELQIYLLKHFDIIDKVSSLTEKQSTALFYRYIMALEWEDIALITGSTKDNLLKIHRRAIAAYKTAAPYQPGAALK